MQVLALQLKRIGDAILTAPALAGLRAALPGGARLSLVLAGAAGELAEMFGMADEVLVWRPKATNFKLLGKLARHQYDLILDFSGNDRAAFLGLLGKGKRRVGYAKDAGNWLRRRAFPLRCAASVRELHTIDFHHALARFAVAELGWNLPAEVPDSGHLRLPGELGLNALVPSGTPFAVVHPGTARGEKYWLPERWAEVISALLFRGLPVILTGSSDVCEQRHIQDILRSARLQGVETNAGGAAGVIDLSGKLTLAQLAWVLSQCRIALGVDSAAQHLAAAFQRPQVALFGPTNPFHWRPRHAFARVLLAGDADNDVAQVFTPHGVKAPMNDLSTDRVLRAMDELLA